MHRVSIIGMGFVGLSMTVFLAENGIPVIGVERDRTRLDLLKQGRTYFHESGIAELLNKSMEKGLITFTDNYGEAVNNSDISFICVGTPSDEVGRQDLSMILSASRSLGESLRDKTPYHLIVMRSTVLPETCRKIVIPSLEEHSGKHVGEDFGFVMNPEFLREGSALNDLREPDRIVIGGYDDKSSKMLLSFYRDIYGDAPNYIKTSIENAEIIKYANNAFLAAKVSFINSIARICETIPNTDIQVVREVIGLDPRIGPLFLNAGIGFGGSCLPKDLRALVYFAKERGYKPVLLEGVYDVNVGQPKWVVMKLKEIYNKLADRKVAVLGLSFKPGTSDIRESQAVKVIEALVDEGCKVSAYDPMANEEFIGKYYHLGVEVSSTIEGCVSGSDAVVIATEWDEFKEIAPEYYLEKMKNPVVIDGRRIYDPKVFLSKGVTYIGVGYPIW